MKIVPMLLILIALASIAGCSKPDESEIEDVRVSHTMDTSESTPMDEAVSSPKQSEEPIKRWSDIYDDVLNETIAQLPENYKLVTGTTSFTGLDYIPETGEMITPKQHQIFINDDDIPEFIIAVLDESIDDLQFAVWSIYNNVPFVIWLYDISCYWESVGVLYQQMWDSQYGVYRNVYYQMDDGFFSIIQEGATGYDANGEEVFYLYDDTGTAVKVTMEEYYAMESVYVPSEAVYLYSHSGAVVTTEDRYHSDDIDTGYGYDDYTDESNGITTKDGYELLPGMIVYKEGLMLNYYKGTVSRINGDGTANVEWSSWLQRSMFDYVEYTIYSEDSLILGMIYYYYNDRGDKVPVGLNYAESISSLYTALP